MLGARSPFSSPWGFGITGSPSTGWTFTKTAEASTAEAIATFGVLDATNKLEIKNASTSNNLFLPTIDGTGSTTSEALVFRGLVTTDSTNNPAVTIVGRTVAGAVLTTRPILNLVNYTTTVLSAIPLNSGANSALSWGAQTGAVPAFTTRSAGTRIVLGAAISGSLVDYAIGAFGGGTAGTWYSVPGATSSYEHRWYAGTTNIASLRGDGQLTTTGGRIKKYRIALTSPVTIAVTDDIVEINLTTPGAVTINYPASPETGREYTIIDGKGDAGANNHTHTPAAGNINGAATVVAAVNYYRGKASYNGTQWLFAKEVP